MCPRFRSNDIRVYKETKDGVIDTVDFLQVKKNVFSMVVNILKK